jgi:hypothetical protein
LSGGNLGGVLEVGVGVVGNVVEDRLLEGQHEETDPNPNCLLVHKFRNESITDSRKDDGHQADIMSTGDGRDSTYQA